MGHGATDTDEREDQTDIGGPVNPLTRKILLTLTVLGGAAALAGGSTLAGFTAQTSNAGNKLAAGTLVLSSTKTSGSTCLSTAGGTTDVNVNATCDKVFDVSTVKPGDVATGEVTLRNAGSLGASSLTVHTSGCTPADAVGELYRGTGDPCGKVQVYIQRWSDASRTVPAGCVFGGAATPGTCDFSDASKTLAAFASAHGGASRLALGALGSGASTYVTVGVRLPADADNSYQGRQASLGFTWTLEQ